LEDKKKMKNKFIKCLLILFTLTSLFFLSSCASNDGPTSENPDPQVPPPLPPPDPSVSIFINQVETECLSQDITEISTYVSVIDELGNPIDDLDLVNFQISENSNAVAPEDVSFSHIKEEITDPISVVIIMDYSTSITDDSERQQAMEDAVLHFIDLMQPNDQAEIIKFNTGIRYVQPFTSDKSVLEEAVHEEVSTGVTYLYDTLYSGIEDVQDESGRKAVVAITDGRENHESGIPGDGRHPHDVITLAQDNEIPLFLIGLGPEIRVDDLKAMAEETSGHYYQAATNNDLQDIYTSISDLFNVGQYQFVFEAPSNGLDTGTLSISVTHNNLTDSAGSTFTYTACP
jgi:VWFA-related protein